MFPADAGLQKFLRYNIKSNKWKKAINILTEANATIGLHSVSTETIQDQYNNLTKAVNQPIDYHRSHYLKYNPEELYKQLNQCHITTDFSLGNARKIELPNQPNPTQLVQCIPTILFDNSFFFIPPQ